MAEIAYAWNETMDGQSMILLIYSLVFVKRGIGLKIGIGVEV
jgi:hypothetical protein